MAVITANTKEVGIAKMDRDEPATLPTERDANARLIAAAPEMLEILRYAESVLNMAVSNSTTYEGKPIAVALADAAFDVRAVIAKATGEKGGLV